MNETNKRPYREHHLYALLKAYDEGNLPLDLAINRYFRSNSSLGSKDRGQIAEDIYALIRWKSLLDHLCKPSITWEKRYLAYKNYLNFPQDAIAFHQDTLPPHVLVSFPENLYQKIEQAYGKEKADDICLASNYPAPTTLRANTLKTNRESLLSLWKDKYDVIPCQHSINGITFQKKINFFTFPEFKKGYFEVQDEASQLVAQLVDIKPGQHVLDYCSGSGGKTLAIAPKMQNKGCIWLHDVRLHALKEAKQRLKRSGVQNAQILAPDAPQLKKIKGKMDWILVDAPCSGTGTLRRNPDMKWRFDESAFKQLLLLQKEIFAKALNYLKPDGIIVYATCSLLKEENQDQMEYFLSHHHLELVHPYFQTIPQQGSMDGFFAAVLRKCSI